VANPIIFIVEAKRICQQIADARSKSLGLARYAANIKWLTFACRA
jgi:hypothetical protein